MTIKVCKNCQRVFELQEMANKRAICKECYKIEYKTRYLYEKDKLKEKRTKYKLSYKLYKDNEIFRNIVDNSMNYF